MAVGIDRAVLLETDGKDWDPVATSAAIVDAIRAQQSAGAAVRPAPVRQRGGRHRRLPGPVRVAAALDLPCVVGIKALEVRDGTAIARREAGGGWEVFEVPLPAVVAVREGINLPRYPSVPGRLRARKKEVERITPEWRPAGPEKIKLRVPEERAAATEILGTGPEAAPKVVELLQRLGLVS